MEKEKDSNDRVDTVDFYVGGAQFRWNSMYTEIRKTSDSRNYTLSFKQIEQAEKKLWVDSKGGWKFNSQKEKDVNHVNQFRTHHKVLSLNPYLVWKRKNSRWLDSAIQLLLVEEIEYYTHLNLSYSRGSLFHSPALSFANAYKEDLFIGHFKLRYFVMEFCYVCVGKEKNNI